MSAFNKKLLADCFCDSVDVDGQARSNTDVVVACNGFELRLNNLMDDRVSLSSDSELQSHADDCVECRQVLQQYQKLELLFGGGQGEPQVGLRDKPVEEAGSRLGSKQVFAWVNFPLTIAALVALLIFAGQDFSEPGNVAVPSVAVAKADSQVIDSQAISVGDFVMSNEEDPLADLIWVSQGPVSQIKGLVDSGSELFSVGEDKVAAIRELSNLNLDLVGLESRLESLQPMLTYSGRIPALSPMQGTVCFTLGWLKKDKPLDSQVDSGESAIEVGLLQLGLRELA